MPPRSKKPPTDQPPEGEDFQPDQAAASADERERLRVEKRFLEIRNEYGPNTESRLRINYKIWWSRKDNDGKKATLRQDEIKELEQFRVIGGKVSNGLEVPAEISMGKFAEFVTEKYGKPIGAQWFTAQVKKWIDRDGMPPVGKGNRLGSGPKWEAWFVANILEKTGNGDGDDSYITKGAKAEAERKITAARREARADMEEMRKCDARWMIYDAFVFWSEGAMTVFRQILLWLLKIILDDVKAAGKEIGLDEPTIERLAAALKPRLDARYDGVCVDLVGDPKTPDSLGKLGELDKAARELSEQKKNELKVKL